MAPVNYAFPCLLLALWGLLLPSGAAVQHSMACSASGAGGPTLHLLHINSSGLVSLTLYTDPPPAGATSNVSSWCVLTLVGCDACRFSLEVTSFSPPLAKDVGTKCSQSDHEIRRHQQCLSGCTHALTYEPSYWDVTERVWSPGGATYTSVSAVVSVMLCEASPHTNRTLTLTYTVQEKRDLLLGGPTSGSTGHMTSPNFPLGYAREGEKYSYMLRNSDPTGSVLVVFDDWDLNYHSRVILYDGDDEYYSAPSVHYGHYFRPTFVTSGPVLLAVFEADIATFTTTSRSLNMGFRATYHFLAGDSVTEVPETDCGGHFRYSSGGSDYFAPSHWTSDKLHDCVWVIHKNSAFHHLQLRFSNISLADSNVSIEVREGMTSLASIIYEISTLSDNGSTSPSFPSTLSLQTKGAYVRLRGHLATTDMFGVTFVSYNHPRNVSGGVSGRQCWRGNEFYCGDAGPDEGGLCIDRHLVCDGHPHCPGAQDEAAFCQYLTHTQPPQRAEYAPVCRSHEVSCASGTRCIPAHALCDQWMDCPDGSDEYYCSDSSGDTPSCGNTSVQCGMRCYSPEDVCILKECSALRYQFGCNSGFVKGLYSRRGSVQIEWSLILPICFTVFCVIIIVGMVLVRARRRPKTAEHRRRPSGRSRRLPIVQRVVRCHAPCSATSSVSSSGMGLLSPASHTSSRSECCCHSPPAYEDSELASAPPSHLSTPSPFTAAQQYKYFSFHNTDNMQTSVT